MYKYSYKKGIKEGMEIIVVSLIYNNNVIRVSTFLSETCILTWVKNEVKKHKILLAEASSASKFKARFGDLRVR